MIRCTFRGACLVTTTFALLLPAVSMPAEAGAQTITSPYEFIEGRHEAGVFLIHVPGNRGTMELGPGDGLLTGARYALDLGGPFALEFTGFVQPTDRRVRAPDAAGQEILELGTASALVGGLDGRVRFTLTGPRTWHNLAPFVVAGGGVVGNLSGRIEEEEELPTEARFTFGPSFMGVLGVGTRYFLTEQLVLRLDATAHFWKLGTPQAYLNLPEEAGPVVQQEWPAVGGFGVGLSWRF
ncbi:MAG: hypothetical protein EA350_01470 [Gemmatimonadales bacterium]|nr:MAG: hypothetical protein EA350_01470 [Gemmatimonadales bacterium]